jgi:hypothetical protein
MRYKSSARIICMRPMMLRSGEKTCGACVWPAQRPVPVRRTHHNRPRHFRLLQAATSERQIRLDRLLVEVDGTAVQDDRPFLHDVAAVRQLKGELEILFD